MAVKKKNQRAVLPVEGIIGQRVKARRLELGMSQTDLARKIGVSYQQVQKYEQGLDRISFSRMMRVAKVMKVNLLHFARGIKP